MRIGTVAVAGHRGRGRRSWREARFAALDFETTGLDPSRDAVVSFGVVPVSRGRVRIDEGVYRAVDPGRDLPPETVAVHGLRPVDLEGAPRMRDVAGELRDALAGSVVLAWASWVEAAFLAPSVGGRARDWERHILDVRRLAAWVGLSEGTGWDGTSTLEEAAKRFGVPFDRAHHALWDAFVTAELFVVLAARMESEGRGDLRSTLWAGRNDPLATGEPTRESRKRP